MVLTFAVMDYCIHFKTPLLPNYMFVLAVFTGSGLANGDLELSESQEIRRGAGLCPLIPAKGEVHVNT